MRKTPEIAPESSQFVSAASLRVRLDWFNKLRWVAVLTVLAVVLLAGLWADHPLPRRSLLVTIGVLALLNAAYVWHNRRVAPADIGSELRLVKLQMLGDLLVLTVLLNLTGGIENPFLFAYVIHVTIASLLFKGREIFAIAWLAIILFTGDVAGEYLGILPHHHLLSASTMTHELPFILVTLAAFWLVLLFSAYMGASIMKHNRSIKDELVDRQRQLVAADRAKVDFFRFVTHEVKSPVSTAQSAVETALAVGGGGMEPPVRDLLERAIGRLGQATGMVKDLADLTRGGLLTPEQLQPVDLKKAVAGVADALRDLAAARDQELVLELPGAPLVMSTNPSMFEKIVANLVGNAVRYNREGGTVRVALEDLGGNGARLRVADEGIGIAPEDHERIFDEFYRTPAAQAISNLGTGLGLPIVRRFVENLHGTIAVDSRPDAGATFTVELPRPSVRRRELEELP